MILDVESIEKYIISIIMIIFINYRSKQIIRGRILTRIIPEDAGNMIHDPKPKYIEVGFCIWYFVYDSENVIVDSLVLSFYFLLLKIQSEWCIREDTLFLFV